MPFPRYFLSVKLIVSLVSGARRSSVHSFVTLIGILQPRQTMPLTRRREFNMAAADNGIIHHLQARVSKHRRVSSVSSAAAAKTVKEEIKMEETSSTSRKVAPDRPYKGSPEKMYPGWTDLDVPLHELRPAVSLTIGQCFNWRQASPACWVGVLGGNVVAVRQTPSTTLFRCLNGHGAALPASPRARNANGAIGDAVLETLLRDYFFLDEPLIPLYKRWSDGDPRMAIVADRIPGVRVVRQDPVECLFSFICSSNNNIPRITLMLDKLRREYGEVLLRVGKGGLAGMGLFVDDEECEDWARLPLELYSFPTVEALAVHATEADLRRLGFGYRAKYIVDSAKLVFASGGMDWVLSMRNKNRNDVRNQLLALGGVGPKVADCVALFSLDQTSAIPVDVHVWRIACRDFDPSLAECRSLTPRVYSVVGDLFRDRFGPHAGWAHSLLFAAELPRFKTMLPSEMQREMDYFRRNERERKAAAKAKKKRERSGTSLAGTKAE